MNPTIFGFKGIEDYENYFFRTLLLTNKTYDYFVDWNKVKRNISKFRKEIYLLNSLREENRDTIAKAFEDLLRDHPQVIGVVPILLAERVNRGKLSIYDIDFDSFIDIYFNIRGVNDEDNLNKLMKFCQKTGIFNLLLDTVDLYDYLKGVEVGLDTNARKGRSGKIFEKMVERMLNEKIIKDFRVIPQDRYISLYSLRSGRHINRHDFVIYKNKDPVAVIEVNFYNTTGSKLASIVGDYINMDREAKKKGITLIWVTDGPGWLNTTHPLRQALENMEYVMNFHISKNNIQKVLDRL